MTLAALGLAAATGRARPPAGTPAAPTITITPSEVRGPISPLIYGTNQRYNNDACGTWDAARKRIRPAFDARHREAGLKSMRYPGGTVASTFVWKRAVGPVESRAKIQPAQGLKPGGGGPEVATWGVDEAARWAEASGVELVYLYGVGAPQSCPQDAADLVEYLNGTPGPRPAGRTDWAQKRADNGHPAPYNVRHFEIANEADGPNAVQRYWLDAIDTDANRAKRKLPQLQQRHSYAPEFCFGGTVAFERQPVPLGDDLRDSAAISAGLPNQRHVLRYFPPTAEPVRVFVGDDEWRAVDDLARAAGRVCRLDAATGEVRFGDGVRGDIPARGGRVTATYRALRAGFVDYYAAIKAVDPGARVYAGFASPKLVSELGDRHPYDGIVVHPYTNEYNVPKARTLDEWHHNLMLSSARLGHEVQAYQDLIDKTVAPARRGRVRVICTEYGPNRQDQTLPAGAADRGTARFLSVGLYDATQLMHWMRAGVPAAHRHATTVGVFGPAPDFTPTASARTFGLFARHFGDRLVGLRLDHNAARQTANYETRTPYLNGFIKRITPGAPADAERLELPTLEAEASRDAKGNVYLMVVNQDATSDATATIRLAGRDGPATARTLNGPSATATTHTITEATPRLEGGSLTYTFPAHSLTSITFPVR